jgi:hypothetical protein
MYTFFFIYLEYTKDMSILYIKVVPWGMLIRQVSLYIIIL